MNKSFQRQKMKSENFITLNPLSGGLENIYKLVEMWQGH